MKELKFVKIILEIFLVILLISLLINESVKDDPTTSIWEILSAVGTVGALIITIGLQFYKDYSQRQKIKENVKKLLAWELYTTYDGFMSAETVLDLDLIADTKLKENIGLFSEVSKNILQIYIPIRHYIHDWQVNGINSIKVLELKLQVIFEFFRLMNLIDYDDYDLDNIIIIKVQNFNSFGFITKDQLAHIRQKFPQLFQIIRRDIDHTQYKTRKEIENRGGSLNIFLNAVLIWATTNMEIRKLNREDFQKKIDESVY